MTLNYENETEITLELGESAESLAEKVILAGLEETGCPFDVQVNLLITDNESIRQMNLSFRQIDEPTDVLSFPMLEYESPADFSSFREGDCSVFDPESGQLMLGDIVINAQRVISQAMEYGHSQRREFAFLIAHSFLHLTGFDHMEEEERAVMEERQRRIMDLLDIHRN
jgi:probable rRNA maturation factor